jgi:hypothetical protein
VRPRPLSQRLQPLTEPQLVVAAPWVGARRGGQRLVYLRVRKNLTDLELTRALGPLDEDAATALIDRAAVCFFDRETDLVGLAGRLGGRSRRPRLGP